MKKKVLIIIAIIVIIILFISALLLQIYKAEQIQIIAQNKKIIKQNGLEYKDLNDNGKLDKYEDWRLNDSERAKDLISQMTIDEKAGMLLITTQTMGIEQENAEYTTHDGIIDEQDTESTYLFYKNKMGTTKTINELNIRHFILRTEGKDASDYSKWANEVNKIAEQSRLGIPVVVISNSRNESLQYQFNTLESDSFTIYPSTLGIAAATLGEEKNKGESYIIENFAKTVNAEFYYSGIRKGYMYMADILTDPRWTRNYGTFGEDTDFVTKTMEKLVKGIQGEELSNTGVALTLKHFPGSGARQNGLDPHWENGQYSPYLTEQSLENYHLKPFEAAIKAGVSSIMPYYSRPYYNSAKQSYMGEEISMDGVSFAYNEEFITNLLKNKMNFNGYINTDSGIIDNIYWGEEDRSKIERIADAINAGTDIISESYDTESVKKAIETGLIKEERLNEALERVLIEMFKLGLFENPYIEENQSKQNVKTEQSEKQAYEVHQKSVVLLKNKNQVLPLQNDETKHIYIDCFESNEEKSVKNKKDMINNLKEKYANINIVSESSEADYGIIFLNPNFSSKIKGVQDINISNNTIYDYDRFLEVSDSIHKSGGKIITIINFNTPWIVKNVEPYCDSILAGFNTYISAVYDIIYNEIQPTGVLPFTIPNSEEIIAIDEEEKCVSPNDVPGYDKNKYLTNGLKYEYVDECNNSYELNFGLTY